MSSRSPVRIAQWLAVFSLGMLASQSHASPWATSLQRFQEENRSALIPAAGVLFLGSSSIVGWSTLAQDFFGAPVVNRGFGGSALSDCVAHFDILVTALCPSVVVLYAGDNDLAAGRSPADVLAEFRRFCARLHAELPQTKLVFISVKPSPLRWSLADNYSATNRLIAQECARDSRRTFLNVFDAMLGPDGRPRAELFREDALHMNARGYQLWAEKLRPLLLPATQPDMLTAQGTGYGR